MATGSTPAQKGRRPRRGDRPDSVVAVARLAWNYSSFSSACSTGSLGTTGQTSSLKCYCLVRAWRAPDCQRTILLPFNAQQPPHIALRSIVAEKTNKLVVWIGSGLSTAAGLPTWTGLKMRLVDQLRVKADEFSAEDAAKMRATADRAESEGNQWLAFQLLRKGLGVSSYHSTIRTAFQPAATVHCPRAYHYVWQLKPAGVVNLNLDRLVTRALGEVSPGRLPAEFSGRNIENYLHSLKSPHPFIANLHGVADDVSSWVFSRGELRQLFQSAGYRTFVTGCFATTTTLFLGVSADDIATGGHLASLAQAGIDTGDHYWLTNRNDIKTDRWAEQAGIRVIRYQDHDEHAEVLEFFEDIVSFVPDDGPSPPPVLLEYSTAATAPLPGAEQLLRLDAEEIREVLNTHATNLFGVGSAESYSAYDEFAKTYDQAIYRAWYTSASPPGNRLLGFTLVEDVARGAFGRVYRATAPDSPWKKSVR